MMMILLVYQAYMGVPKMVKWNLTQSHQKGFNTNTNHLKFMFQTTNQMSFRGTSFLSISSVSRREN
jgi:hypothetical protein